MASQSFYFDISSFPCLSTLETAFISLFVFVLFLSFVVFAVFSSGFWSVNKIKPPCTVASAHHPDILPAGSKENHVSLPILKQVGGGSDEAIIYMTSDNMMDNKAIQSILNNPEKEKMSSIPPYRPKGGDVYLITSGTDNNRSNDWACDGYMWVNKGGYGIPKNNPVIFARRYNLSQHKGDTKGNDQFQRRVYINKDLGLTLVHYVGDHSLYVPRPHGNDRSQNPSEYRRTLPSVLHTIKERTLSQQTNKVYKQMASNGVKGIHQGVLNPRNSKQAKNHRYQVQKSHKISHDEIYNTLQLAYHIDGLIHDIGIYPDLSVILAHPEILAELNKVLLVKSDEPVLLSYDTTFNIGDFYVSVLVFKHILFQGGITIPVGFLIHDRKCDALHDKFWNIITKAIPNLQKSSPVIVTDREQSIKKAVLKYASQAKFVHCWNHIKKDITYWLKDHGGKSDDKIVYSNDIKELLHTTSIEEFEELLCQICVNWDAPFLEYFEDNLKGDIVNHACRWVLEEAGVYDPYSGITNNICEGMNTVIKRLVEWQQVPLDSVILSFNYLQNFYIHELLRGFCGVGDYQLKSRHSSAALEKDEVHFPQNIIQPSDIVEQVKANLNNNTDQDELGEVTETETFPGNASSFANETGSTQRALALAVVRDKKIYHVPEAGAFIVEGSRGDKYTVQLHPKETCLCPSLGTCYHILAARMSIGVEDLSEKRILNLTQLRKNTRKRPNRKAGTKQPRPCDREISIIPAPNSTAMQDSFICSTPHVNSPTKTPRSIVKKRTNTPGARSSRKKIKFESPVQKVMTTNNSPADVSPKDKTPRQSVELLNDTSNTPCQSSEPKNMIAVQSPDSSPLATPFKPVSPKTSPNNNSQSPLPCFQNSPSPNTKANKRVWINFEQLTLYVSQKSDILFDKYLDCQLMNYAQRILKLQFPNIYGFQYTGYAPIWENDQWHYAMRMKPVQSPAAQIHHTGHVHWITSVSHNGNIYVLDSKNSLKVLSSSTQIQLSSLFANGNTNIEVQIPHIQQQTNGVDCGVFAIANMTEFCFNGYTGDQDVKFDEFAIRGHLLKCLENNHFTPFPKMPSRNKKLSLKRKSSKVTIEMDCNGQCRMPNIYENMVSCDKCSCWMHYSCANSNGNLSVSSFSGDRSFVCRSCI